jgi:hypothetical protein
MVKRYAEQLGYSVQYQEVPGQVLYTLNRLNKDVDAGMSLDEERQSLVWLKGKLQGSYTDRQLKDMGARLVNGQWAMPQAIYNRLTSTGQLRESANSNTIIDAHRVGNTVVIDYFEVKPRGQGLGTKEYEKFENNLPPEITMIRVHASDAGEGPSHGFWDAMGFDYEFPDDDNYMVKHLNSHLREASGYIPSKAEKNDPRFKTALTVDVHPDSIQQNAKKLGSKIKRSGVPPTLKASGKI